MNIFSKCSLDAFGICAYYSNSEVTCIGTNPNLLLIHLASKIACKHLNTLNITWIHYLILNYYILNLIIGKYAYNLVEICTFSTQALTTCKLCLKVNAIIAMLALETISQGDTKGLG